MLGLSALGSCSAISAPARSIRSRPCLAPLAAPSAGRHRLGALSLVLWTLIIITSVKYVSFAMRVDNDGEGGILALMSLLGVKKQQRPTIVAVGLFGAALIYGDGAITPAISVLSALEGLNIATPALQPYVLAGRGGDPAWRCSRSSRRARRASVSVFGPIMVLWFVAIAVLGICGHRAASGGAGRARIPLYGLSYLFSNGVTGFLVLGGGVPLRHRRRSALCRHGAFRRAADPTRLVGASSFQA